MGVEKAMIKLFLYSLLSKQVSFKSCGIAGHKFFLLLVDNMLAD